MTKRQATYDIDPSTFEEKERDLPNDDPVDSEGSHMKNRKIYKLKRVAPEPSQQSKSKPSLTIIGLSDQLLKNGQSSIKQPLKVEPSIFNTNLFSSPEGVGLFTNLFSKTFLKEETKPNDKQKNQNQSQKQGLTSIFSKGPSIFDGEQKKSVSIFQSSVDNTKSQIKSNLFSGGQANTGGTNIFKFSEKSLFGASANNSVAKGEDQEGEGDSAELQRNQEMEVNPSKSEVTYDYKSECQILKSVKLSKFKKDKGDLVDSPLKASFLFDKESKNYYITVQIIATHKIILSGIVIQGKSYVRILNNKNQNLQILVFSLEKQHKKLEQHVIRLQIRQQDGQENQSTKFLQLVRQVIEGQNKSKKSE